METATTTKKLTKAQKQGTFSHTIREWNRQIADSLKRMQAAEEQAMTGDAYQRKVGRNNAGWETNDIIEAAKAILHEAKMAQEAYTKGS